ncbi:hypothetical protein SEPCBS119000_002352 [Sporothrix epigloea]|uniref:Zn(2)-C6 fungal-type domain-containing protein n=1 Tax=Sporothrix epigloea TaxID=1892477 RepID=A0ABP0DHF9_9PEZI
MSTSEVAAPLPETEKPGAATAATPKRRSCVTCRQRRVRCDKLSPCSNCCRADIPCLLPSTERPPRWARRLKQQQQQQQQHQLQKHLLPSASGIDLSAQNSRPNDRPHSSAFIADVAPVLSDSSNQADVSAVLDRLKKLEALVRNLDNTPNSSTQPPALDSGSLAGAVETAPTCAGAAFGTAHVQERFGRLILDDQSNRRRYVGSGFWSRINDELDLLREQTGSLAQGDNWLDSTDDDSDINEDDTSNVHSALSPAGAADAMYIKEGRPNRKAADRSAFMFGHNLQPALGDASQYRPLPSQIPFLWQVYTVNVHILTQVVHVPTINGIIRGLLGDIEADAGQQPDRSPLTPATEALIFAIYYAAVVSMEDEDVIKNFAMTRDDLSLKFRVGLELSLTKANFLENFDLEIVQALVIFLLLCRRYDSPRFVWMMTGVVIRMAKGLGLHRDGSSFGSSLTAYEVEMRRRVWWTICAIDVRSAEDQGTDLTILPSDFDTRFPLNINDSDISQYDRVTEPPVPRDEMTDVTFALLNFEVTGLAQRMMASAAAASKETGLRGDALLGEQNRMLDEVYQRLESVYLRHSPDTTSVIYWTGITIVRLFLAKMTLILNLPRLIHEKKGSEEASTTEIENLRMRLLSSAIEVAEYCDALKTERACRRWRWLCETYTQWHTIAFLLMETGRRPWDPAVERAWVALHGPYLIPAPPTSLRKKEQQQQQRESETGEACQPVVAREASVGTCSTAGTSSSDLNKGSKSTSSADSSKQFFWLPLRRLMARARRHRASELARLRADMRAAHALEIAYDLAVADGRSRPLSNPGAVDAFRDRWRRLVGLAEAASSSPPIGNASKPPARVQSLSTGFSCADLLSRPNQPSRSATAGNTSSPSPLNLRQFSDLTEAEYTSVDFPAPDPNSVDAFILNSASQATQQRHQQDRSSTFSNKDMMRPDQPWSNFDPWQMWGNPDQSNGVFDANAGAASNLIKETPLLFVEDLGMDLGAEPNIDWDDWFASSRAF